MSHIITSEHSLKKEIALFISLVGGALSLVGLIATAWAKPDVNKDHNRVREIGLWRYCEWSDTDPEKCFPISNIELPSWFHVVQALSVLGFILEIVTLTLTIVSECAKGCRQNLKLVFSFVASGFASSAFIASALIIFGIKIEGAVFASGTDTIPELYSYRPGFAFILTGIGAGIQPITAILGLLDAAEKRNKRVTSDNLTSGRHPYGSMAT